jgi:shikimate dehydrogenase
LPVRYELVDVAPSALDALLDALIAENVWGNATIPHKEHVAARCARVTPLAERVGAVNTFWVESETLVGDNTDVGGFRALLEATAPDLDRTKPVTLLGAGGSAAAVLAALELDGFADVRVHSRTEARALTLCERFTAARAVSDKDGSVRGASLVINATPSGLDDESMPVDVERLEPSAVVLDLVVGRNETPWVRAARARGHRAADGLAMLIEQGALAFERWFGMVPDRDVMRQAIAR